jgi:penicillin-binding protein 1C
LSLNTPAVAVLDEVGPSRLIARLAQAGAPLVLPKDEAPGLALGLGGVGVRLLDLTMLYAGLARQGTVAPLVEEIGRPQPATKRLIEPVAAWYVGSVLLGTPPPENAAGGRIAFKTGTSYGYRAERRADRLIGQAAAAAQAFRAARQRGRSDGTQGQDRVPAERSES